MAARLLYMFLAVFFIMSLSNKFINGNQGVHTNFLSTNQGLTPCLHAG